VDGHSYFKLSWYLDISISAEGLSKSERCIPIEYFRRVTGAGLVIGQRFQYSSQMIQSAYWRKPTFKLIPFLNSKDRDSLYDNAI